MGPHIVSPVRNVIFGDGGSYFFANITSIFPRQGGAAQCDLFVSANYSYMPLINPKITKWQVNYDLVGGLEHQFYFPIYIYILGIIIPIDFHIFQRGGPTTNQWYLGFNGKSAINPPCLLVQPKSAINPTENPENPPCVLVQWPCFHHFPRGFEWKFHLCFAGACAALNSIVAQPEPQAVRTERCAVFCKIPKYPVAIHALYHIMYIVLYIYIYIQREREREPMVIFKLFFFII